ncbi:hypothetical protein [Sphingobium ummariense]|uniref:Uncharacterized protein n=1 Tax=Sphingobium ummariense RL-3 TaxID=1346791 RepID=T0K5R3_9SPHN|nr:hypothetical protein [Sphingobium ummariense]EQB32009.1 hypothetical protein M529_11735 [Sphingobium ummariense RL-3]
MNRVRRKEIEGVIAMLEDIQQQIETQADIVADIASDEEAYRDGIPESMQEGPRYEKADAAANALCDAHADLSSLALDDIIERLREAML